jgi:acetyl esterase/lipase
LQDPMPAGNFQLRERAGETSSAATRRAVIYVRQPSINGGWFQQLFLATLRIVYDVLNWVVGWNRLSLVREKRAYEMFSANWSIAGLAAVAALAFGGTTVVQAEDGIVVEKGIEYANPDNQHLMLDMARPDGDGPYPAVVCIHGGGFRAGKREGYDRLIKTLAKNGYVAVTVTYRLAPKYQFPAAVYDVKAAVRWLRANAAKYHIDPARIAAIGGSAGGHLALFLGVTGDVKRFEGDGGNLGQSSRVACVVSFYGPSDFTKSYGKSVDAADVLPLFLGGNLQQARERHIEASPLYWVTPEAAPTLCVHGTKDNYVAFEQAQWIVDRLKAAGVEAELLPMEGSGHGFQGKAEEKAEAAMLAFLDGHLKSGESK